MYLRKFQLEDFEELVDMLYAFTKETNEGLKLNPKYFYYKQVIFMINSKNNDVVLAVNKDGIICGFSYCRLDTMDNLLEAFYNCEYCYVKPEFRKTRAAYMLYKNSYKYAIEKKLTLRVSGRIENGVAKMIEKHFMLEPKYTLFEGVYNG